MLFTPPMSTSHKLHSINSIIVTKVISENPSTSNNETSSFRPLKTNIRIFLKNAKCHTSCRSMAKSEITLNIRNIFKMFYFLQKNKTKMTPNQRNIPRRINQSRIPESEIQKYWAAYMNMARHNLFTTLKFIGETVGVSVRMVVKQRLIEQLIKKAFLHGNFFTLQKFAMEECLYHIDSNLLRCFDNIAKESCWSVVTSTSSVTSNYSTAVRAATAAAASAKSSPDEA